MDGARRADLIDVAEGELLHFFLDLAVRKREIARLPGIGDGEVRAAHLERREYLLAREKFPRLVRDLSGQIARGHEHQVLILERRAEILSRLQVPQALAPFL